MRLDTNTWVEFNQGGYRIRALAPFRRFRGVEIPWDSPGDLMADADDIMKDSRSRKVIRLCAGQFGLPVQLCVKRYFLRSWLRLILRAPRRSRAREEFDLGWKLMSKGVKTPRPVWLAEGYDTNAAYSMIATELLPDSESALARWQRCENEKQRRELLIAMGQFTGRLHDLGFYHDDYKAAHLLIFPDRPSLPGEFHLIDLLGGSFPAVMTPLGRAKNLYQLIRSLKPKRRDYGFTPEHRDILLLAYSGSALDAVSWGKWVNRVGRLKGRMV